MSKDFEPKELDPYDLEFDPYGSDLPRPKYDRSLFLSDVINEIRAKKINDALTKNDDLANNHPHSN